jgi:glycosyltransferase involved in cell wall biosynthesis
MKTVVNSPEIAIYEDLPSGGAKRLCNSLVKKLSNTYTILVAPKNDYVTHISNIFKYYWYVFMILPKTNKILVEKINKTKILIAFQSWVTKSPIIMKNIKIPVVYICHEPPREFYDEDYIKTFTLKEKLVNFIGLIIKYLDKNNITKTKKLTIITNSHYSAEQIAKAYDKNAKVIYPGINTATFGKRKIWAERSNQVISVGSLNKLKNQLYIIKCIAQLPEKIRPLLILVGNGGNNKYIQEISACAKDNRVNIIIKLNIEDRELIKLYKSSRLFIYSPINEPFGLVILEALASGLPIVAINKGGFPEILSRKNGFLLDKYVTTQWANKIQSLLENKSVWDKISKYNYEYSKSFRTDDMNTNVVKVINDLLKETSNNL